MKKTLRIPHAVISCIAAAIIVLGAALLIIHLINSAGNRMKRECELFFLNNSQATLQSEMRVFSYKDETDLYIKVIEGLIKGPDSSGLKPVMDSSVEFLTIDLQDRSNIVANFSSEFLSGDNATDVLRVYAVVKTLCSLNNVSTVKVTVEGTDIHTQGGEVIGFLSAEDINLVTDINQGEMHEIVLYFAHRDSGMLCGERRQVKITDQLPLAQHVVQELIKGPQSPELVSCISQDTGLISVTLSDNKCYVDFSDSFIGKNAGTAEREQLAVYSIVNSLTELDTVGRVQFLINGKKTEGFSQLPINGLFERNAALIEGVL